MGVQRCSRFAAHTRLSTHTWICNLLKLGIQFLPHALLYTGPEDAAEASTSELAARAAQGQLLLQLHALLKELQACSSSSSSSRAVHAGRVQSALSWHLPEGMLEHGYQHDTAEAFEVWGVYLFVAVCHY
jgi:hypothetical protein